MIPNEPTILTSEYVKVTSGQSPKEVIKTGVRLQLGITKFQPDDPIAKEIHDEFVKNRHRYYGIKHGDPNWMEHTLIAQRIVQKHGLKVHDPIVFNPFPLWMRKPRFGEIVFGVRLPTIQQVKSESVTFTTWEGYPDFARDVVLEKLGVIDIKPKIRGFNGLIYHGGGQMIECVLCGIGWNPKFGLTCSICKRTWTPNGEDDIAGPFLTPNLKSLIGSSSSNQEGIQIFIKSLLGLSLTVKPSANDTVKDLINLLLEKTYETCQGVDLDLFTAEQTKWESGKFGLNYKGKTLEEERTLSEYGVEKGSTLYMVLKMSGEGKRPAAAVAKKSKEEKTEEAITQYKETMLLLATRAGNPICAETGRQCEALFEQVEGGSDTVVSDALAGLSILELQKLQGSFTSNGEDTRVKALAKAIFGAATSEIVAMKANMAAAEKAAEQVTTICFYTQFMTEAGGFEWDKYRKAVTKAMTDIAEDRGYEAGRNEAANSVA